MKQASAIALFSEMKNYMIRAELKQHTELRPLPISDSRDSEINIDGLPDYRMNESADVK